MHLRNIFRGDDLDALVRRVERLGAQRAPLWGRMTCGQMVCHATDLLSAALGERRVTDRQLRHRWRLLLRLYALHLPARWPRHFPTVLEADSARGGTGPTSFNEDRARLIEQLRRFAARRELLDGCEHILFGRLTSWEWGRWAYLHTDHHLRQFGE